MIRRKHQRHVLPQKKERWNYMDFPDDDSESVPTLTDQILARHIVVGYPQTVAQCSTEQDIANDITKRFVQYTNSL